jgi:hypothetical protein
LREPHGRLAGSVSLLLCFAGLGLPAQASAVRLDPHEGSIGIQLLEAPVDRRADPRALRYIVDHLPPGSVIQRRVLVANGTDEWQHIEVYPAAATVEKEGFQFGEGHATNELTSWISLDHSTLDLAPGDEARVLVTIQIPPPASAGERYAVIWASLGSDPSSGNVKQVHRVGVRVYLDVGAGGEPPSSFAIGTVTPARDAQGQPSVTIRVTNTGGRALDMGGSVALTDGPAGMRAGPFTVMRGTTLAAGQAGSVAVGFPRDLPNGPWKIEVKLESGMVKHTATGSVTFPDPAQVGEPSTLLSRLTSPWSIAGGFVIVLLGIAGVVLVARQARIRGRRTLP